MNTNAAFVLWLTLSGVLSSRSAHRILSHGRTITTGARFAMMSGFSEFEAVRNRAGNVEFQGLLPLAEGADETGWRGTCSLPLRSTQRSETSGIHFSFPPLKNEGVETSAKRVETSRSGENGPGRTERDGLAGGVTGEGARASGASSAPQAGVVIGKDGRQDRRGSHGLVRGQKPTAKIFPVL